MAVLISVGLGLAFLPLDFAAFAVAVVTSPTPTALLVGPVASSTTVSAGSVRFHGPGIRLARLNNPMPNMPARPYLFESLLHARVRRVPKMIEGLYDRKTLRFHRIHTAA